MNGHLDEVERCIVSAAQRVEAIHNGMTGRIPQEAEEDIPMDMFERCVLFT